MIPGDVSDEYPDRDGTRSLIGTVVKDGRSESEGDVGDGPATTHATDGLEILSVMGSTTNYKAS